MYVKIIKVGKSTILIQVMHLLTGHAQKPGIVGSEILANSCTIVEHVRFPQHSLDVITNIFFRQTLPAGS